MTRTRRFEPVFVDLMPSTLEPDVLYVSIPYLLTAHLCACGCGEKVVLPLHPQQWNLTYDGQSVSMAPSVGNVGLDCRSHYWITAGRVDWSMEINDYQARQGHARNRRDLAQADSLPQAQEDKGMGVESSWVANLWSRLTQRNRRN